MFKRRLYYAIFFFIFGFVIVSVFHRLKSMELQEYQVGLPVEDIRAAPNIAELQKLRELQSTNIMREMAVQRPRYIFIMQPNVERMKKFAFQGQSI